MISRKFIREFMQRSMSDSLPVCEEQQEVCIQKFSDLLDSCIEASNMAVMAVDMERRVVVMNGLAASLLGCSENSLIDRRIAEVLPNSPLSAADIQNYRSIPQRFELEGKKLFAERSLVYCQQEAVALISYFQDVTNSETATERLAQARQQQVFFNDIIENSYDGIYITDCNGKTLLVNKSYERISGIKRESLIGEYMDTLVSSGLLSTSLTREVVSGKETVTRTQKTRNEKEVIITGSPIFDEDGNVRHVITNVRDITELVSLNSKLEAQSRRADLYQEQLMHESADENIVYESREFQEVLSIAGKVSRMDSTVLVLGETGVGKEIVAQYIHKHSNRGSKPYIKINCGAIPQNLLESELFGYVPGAFTGAGAKGKPGYFELADGGTLFLDEIGELPLDLQSSLLRVLQDGEITRVGDAKSRKVDVRIITATNRVLEQMIEEGTFRHDLYYRLNVVSVTIPPLRERKVDIPPLAEKALRDLNRKYQSDKTFSDRFMRSLMAKNWPGNIRELNNYIEKQFVLSDDNAIDGNDTEEPTMNVALPSDPLPTYDEAKAKMERELFSRAMAEGGSTYRAAALLGMTQPTFFRKYKQIFPKGESSSE